MLENNVFILGAVFIPLLAAFLCLPLAGNNRIQRIIGLISGALAWGSALAVLIANLEDDVPQIYRMGDWEPPYGIVFVGDLLSSLFVLMTTTILFAGLLYVYFSQDKSAKYPAFVPSFLTMCAGLAGAFYTGDIFTLFVFIELTVISSVILVATSDNPFGLEAAIKYLLISGLGTLFLLIGIAAFYITFGTLNMADIGRLLQAEGDNIPLLSRAAAVMLMSAFLLKSAVFPFHFWQPDFHTTAPTAVGAMLSSVVVKIGVYGIIRLLTLFAVQDFIDVLDNVLLGLGLIGIFFGSLAALRTYHAKRLLAYSTFGQIGFILVGLGWGTMTAMVGAIVYAVNHAFIKSSLLMLTGVVSSKTEEKTGDLVRMVGVGKSMTMNGILYFLGGLALSGVPPLNGFISKLSLVQGGIDAEIWWTIGLVVGSGLLTLLYMMRTWSLIFQQKPNFMTAKLKDYAGAGDRLYAPALLIAICVGLGLYASPLIELVEMTVEQIENPNIYINAVLLGR